MNEPVAVCVQTTFRKLHTAMDGQARVGMVRYVDYDKGWIPESNPPAPFLYKRKSFGHEREVRALIYAEAGVIEYWIVCPEERRVEVYRQPGPKGYGGHIVVASPAMLGCAWTSRCFLSERLQGIVISICQCGRIERSSGP